jgi:protein-S-isoprenylcysteine O-methyltransferase Ste14
MTVAHLVFAIMSTAYILVGLKLEERDLIAAHPEYADYKKRVPGLLPLSKLGGKRGSQTRPVASRTL